jgi:hypothetical protein
MTAISRSKVKIWVVPASTNASALETTDAYSSTHTSGYITGEIKSYSKSGGENDVESDPVFGGYVDKEKPTTQFELSFDIVPSLEKADLWEAMVYGADNGALTSAGTKPANRAVFIEALADTTNVAAWGFNNCSVSGLDMEHSADDNMTKTLKMKFSPTDTENHANYIFNSYSRDTTFNGVSDFDNWSDY